MSKSLRIAIAEDEHELLVDLEETLHEFGHQVVAKANNGRELVQLCRETRPDLVITDIKMPEMDGLEAAEQIRDESPLPIIILSAYHDSEFVERALKENVLAFLVKPLSDQSLKTSITLAMRRFKEFQLLEQQAIDLQQALEDRKIIERAKGIIMSRAELSEQDAFRRLQLLSSQKNQKLVEIAHTIVDAEDLFKL
ncbi:ANTAR domain-containing response regulator [Gimesia algae]|uniref:Putative transcriptional regulatory protein pdtaR n=1 Tax=Gimesia algae TaxID=2527971 RepID=A0A517VET2_9PLAN|nr:response regulator [Gimesia algae]QDT91522.1 putative transcriptional regulatory protein pdtaR [Gimesia algae]